MKKLLFALSLIVLVAACDNNDQDPAEPTEFGFLALNVSLNITSEPASGRVEAVSTDDWLVIIYDADTDTPVETFDPFINAPAEIQLPTGEYYVTASSNDQVEAAFESPFYFGRSANFNIDKEELKTVDVVATLANTKVAILYSDDVINTFDSYTGEVTVTTSGNSLLYDQGETRPGYFVLEPLAIEVNLSYIKIDGTTIDRQFSATIDDPQPATLYNIQVDASLEDGKIMLNVMVDESVTEVNIELTDNSNVDIPPGCYLEGYQLVEGDDIETYAISYNTFGKIESISRTDNFGGDPLDFVLSYDSENRLVAADAADRSETFEYLDDQEIIRRTELQDFGGGLELNKRVDLGFANGRLEFYGFDEFVNNAFVRVETEDLIYEPGTTAPLAISQNRLNQGQVVTRILEFTYDDKINPLFESDLWICDDCIDYEYNMYSLNNITRIDEKQDPAGPVLAYVDIAYTYNADGYPTTAVFELYEEDFLTDTYTINFSYGCYD